MKKTMITLTATLMTVVLIGGCSSVRKPGEPPISYSGTGYVVEYHANGKISRKTEYLNGEMTSDVTYYASGTEKSNAHYTQGEMHDATYYFASGRVKAEIRPK